MITTPWAKVPREPAEDPGGAEPEPAPQLADLPPVERLYAAMVAGCAQVGFENLTVAHLLKTANLSRTTFYENFGNKDECFVATLRTILDQVVNRLEEVHRTVADPEARARAAHSVLLEMASAQRAAARLCTVEPFVVGGEALEALTAAIDRVERFTRRALSDVPGREPLPKDLSQAVVGGVFQVLFRRLSDDSSLDGLEQPLWDWMLSYEAPPVPLRLRGWRPKPPPPGSAPPFAQLDRGERIVRAFASAVAEKGYRSTTISDIASRASVSQRTIYEYFDNKEAILDSALLSSGMQMAAAIVPATRRAASWPETVRAAAGATTRWFAAEPDFARLRQVEIYAAGLEAIRRRDQMAGPIMETAFEDVDLGTVTGEAIVGALFALYYEWIQTRGTETLPESAPLVTYIALAPILGAERACEVANGDGR